MAPIRLIQLHLPSLAGVATGAVIQSGARIDGGNVLALATTGDSQVQSGALLSGKNFSAISGDITFVGSGAAPASGMVIDARSAGAAGAIQQRRSAKLWRDHVPGRCEHCNGGG